MVYFILLIYWSAGFETFLQADPLASHWLQVLQTVRQWQGKHTNKTPLTLQAANQLTIII